MTDECYVLSMDNRERAASKTGARHRKCGAKSKKCTLPSDRMTKKERERMNGPVTSISMNKPYTEWKNFLKLPNDIQQKYLQGLVDKYGARSTDVASMFGVTKKSVTNMVTKHHLDVHFKGRGTKKMDKRFENFLNDIFILEMDKPFTDWRKFRSLPEETQTAYIQNLVDTYGARAPDIALMFGVKTVNLRTVCYAYQTPVKFNGMHKQMDERFKAFLNPEEEKKEEPVEVATSIEAEAIELEVKPYAFDALLSGRFTAAGSKNDILQMLDAMLNDSNKYELSFELSVVKIATP